MVRLCSDRDRLPSPRSCALGRRLQLMKSDKRASGGADQGPACCSDSELNARIAGFFDRRTERRRGADRALPSLSPVSESLLAALGPDTESGRPTVLELGSGTGGLSVELLRRGALHATGVDLSPASIATARERLEAAGLPDTRATFIAGDAAE